MISAVARLCSLRAGDEVGDLRQRQLPLPGQRCDVRASLGLRAGERGGCCARPRALRRARAAAWAASARDGASEPRARRLDRRQDLGVLAGHPVQVVDARQRLVEARGAEDHLERRDVAALVERPDVAAEALLRDRSAAARDREPVGQGGAPPTQGGRLGAERLQPGIGGRELAGRARTAERGRAGLRGERSRLGAKRRRGPPGIGDADRRDGENGEDEGGGRKQAPRRPVCLPEHGA